MLFFSKEKYLPALNVVVFTVFSPQLLFYLHTVTVEQSSQEFPESLKTSCDFLRGPMPQVLTMYADSSGVGEASAAGLSHVQKNNGGDLAAEGDGVWNQVDGKNKTLHLRQLHN